MAWQHASKSVMNMNSNLDQLTCSLFGGPPTVRPHELADVLRFELVGISGQHLGKSCCQLCCQLCADDGRAHICMDAGPQQLCLLGIARLLQPQWYYNDGDTMEKCLQIKQRGSRHYRCKQGFHYVQAHDLRNALRTIIARILDASVAPNASPRRCEYQVSGPCLDCQVDWQNARYQVAGEGMGTLAIAAYRLWLPSTLAMQAMIRRSDLQFNQGPAAELTS